MPPGSELRCWKLRTFACIGALLVHAAGCTKLDSPNDYFPTTVRTASNSGTGGTESMPASSDIEAPVGGSHARNVSAVLRAGSAGAYPTQFQAGATFLSAGATGLGGTTTVDPCWYQDSAKPFGCYRCVSRNILEMEQACTDADCVAFDNAVRLTKWSKSSELPALPTASTSITSPASAGAGASSGTSVPAIGGGGGTGGFQWSSALETGRGGTSSSRGSGAQAGAGGAVQGSVSTDRPCDELHSNGKVVYLTGSSAAKPFLQEIARQLVKASVYVVYVPTGSCAGVDAVLNRTRIGSSSKSSAEMTAQYWSSEASTGESCRIASTGIATDIGISDVFAQSCPGFELAGLDALGIRDAHGPIQTMAFVVPGNSSQRSISAQAAYFVFGFGEAGGIVSEFDGAPVWNDESQLFVRKPSSGTQAMLAAAIGVPSERWRGRACTTSDEVAEELRQAGERSATSADKAIGILAVDYIDSKDLRGQLRTLAFQDTKQLCSYFPDSTLTAHDKRNVRDGHYPLFGPLHLLYRVDATGVPENSLVRQEILDILGYLSGSKALPNQGSLLSVYAQRGLVPECAMRVTRTQDGGNLLPFVSSNPCSCAFEFAATGVTSCVACRVQADCGPDEACSMGYCEK